jgi:hypothetical protein
MPQAAVLAVAGPGGAVVRNTFLAVSWVLSAAGPLLVADAGSKCCFTNPAYTGVCQVTPQEGETCGSILSYLNTPNSVGKTYCGETNIRGGWQQSSCSARVQAPPPPARPAEDTASANRR